MEDKKVWFVFGCDQYYPCGGMADFMESFYTEEEAIEFKEKNVNVYDYITITNISDVL